MTIFPIFLVVLTVFLNRYLAGPLFARLRGARFDGTRDDYEPTVSVVIPMFNEGQSIYHTIRSLLGQRYPSEKLSIIVIDDCSKDDSFQWAQRAAAECPERVLVVRNAVNMGKRRGINRAVRVAQSEIIVSVDSDVVVEPDAVAQLVRRFVDPRIAAVGGRVEVLNASDNWLSRMQAIKYYFGYVYLKSLERSFRSVMCLSGCLTAYRRSVLLELEPVLENRAVLGVQIKYGEDRFLTRQIVRAGYLTTLTLDARCYTKAPTTLSGYFAQQLRWRRSNLVDFMLGMSHAWRLHPVVGLHYCSLFALLLGYPLVVVDNVVSGQFFPLALAHLAVLSVLGLLYHFDDEHVRPERKVHPIWFLSLGVIMPVTYLLHTVLALFTLDSGSWETRGHTETVAAPVPVAAGEPARMLVGSMPEASA